MKWLVERWKKIPLKVMWTIVAACLVFGEQYPFSDFPMFGSFVGKTYYLYLADQNGKPIPAMLFGVPTNGIKKFYDGRLRQLKKSQPGLKIDALDDREVASQTLQYLLPKQRRNNLSLSALQLVRVDVLIEKNQLVKKTRVAAQTSLP